MNRIRLDKTHLIVDCKNSTKIDHQTVRKLFRVGKKMSQQNHIDLLVIDLSVNIQTNPAVLTLVERSLKRLTDFPIIMVAS